MYSPFSKGGVEGVERFMRLLNINKQKELRRSLRKNMTPSERKLWYKLNRNQLGLRFFRQYGIGHYVVDFCCPKKKIVIEVDGDVHGFDNRCKKDDVRSKWLRSLNYAVLRFTNNEVGNNIDSVLNEIHKIIESPNSLCPPLEKGDQPRNMFSFDKRGYNPLYPPLIKGE